MEEMARQGRIEEMIPGHQTGENRTERAGVRKGSAKVCKFFPLFGGVGKIAGGKFAGNQKTT
jgi:hypothetical protein